MTTYELKYQYISKYTNVVSVVTVSNIPYIFLLSWYTVLKSHYKDICKPFPNKNSEHNKTIHNSNV